METGATKPPQLPVSLPFVRVPPSRFRKKSLTLFSFRAPLPPLPSGEGAACAPGRDAEGRGSRGGRSVCARLGRPPRLQGFSRQGSVRRRTGGPEDIRPPATT